MVQKKIIVNFCQENLHRSFKKIYHSGKNEKMKKKKEKKIV
jgi:hypothetical protein